jgi:TPR repeat protein
MFGKACDLNYAQGCKMLGIDYGSNPYFNVLPAAERKAKASELFKKACALGAQETCAW